MTITPGQFKPRPRAKYPHFLPSDTEIWDRFLKSKHNKFTSVDYDIHVGDGQEPNPNYPPNIIAMTKVLTQLRIDVIGYTTDEYTIIEVKAWPGVSAVGQLVCYRDLYLRQYKPPKLPQLLLVSNTITPDIEYCCNANYIQSIVV